jgi:hypothetical protein
MDRGNVELSIGPRTVDIHLVGDDDRGQPGVQGFHAHVHVGRVRRARCANQLGVGKAREDVQRVQARACALTRYNDVNRLGQRRRIARHVAVGVTLDDGWCVVLFDMKLLPILQCHAHASGYAFCPRGHFHLPFVPQDAHQAFHVGCVVLRYTPPHFSVGRAVCRAALNAPLAPQSLRKTLAPR